VREITLTQGKVALVDDEDFERVSQYKWHFSFCLRGVGYARRDTSIKGKKIRMYLHRFILNAPIGADVDHINRETLDNRKSNLRICSRSENLRNALSRTGATSKYKGVGWDKSRKKWSTKINLHGKTINLGRFKSEIVAAKAYNRAALKYHGEFARVNEVI